MADQQFEFGRIYQDYASRAARAAVLYPLFGSCKKSHIPFPDQFVAKVRHAQAMWRRHVLILLNHGWRVGAVSGLEDERQLYHLQYLRNCQPTFIVTDPVLQCCRRRDCFWCAAREVQDIYRIVAANIRHAHVVTRQVSLALPFDDTAESRAAAAKMQKRIAAAEQAGKRKRACYKPPKNKKPPEPPEPDVLLDRERFLRRMLATTLGPARRKWVDEQHARGVIVWTIVEPWVKCWHVEHRYLFIFDADTPTPPGITARPNAYRRYDKLTRRQLIPIIGRLCRYPVGLYKGLPWHAAVAMNALSGLRRFVRYGCLRDVELKHIQKKEKHEHTDS